MYKMSIGIIIDIGRGIYTRSYLLWIIQRSLGLGALARMHTANYASSGKKVVYFGY